ncbi:uncharacterized protein LOC125141053 [Tachysurus fulvidraco]|uniref:uncharacterized protein LOC125141053 n=1 Tax=Tachysurus fulvidraco TaxID=1234273 RepID=UPI001FEFB1AA|nr:uncharacterized protein LOC125141053 [Tachysurus fulvidraco]
MVEQEIAKIRKDKVRKALRRIKSEKAVRPDDIPVDMWKGPGATAVEFLSRLFSRILASEKMPEEWRRSALFQIFKNKGDVQSCSNDRGIKMMIHTMKLWEKVVEVRLIKEKYRDGQKELHCVFVGLEKAYDRVLREQLWYCLRMFGVAEKYIRIAQDMYERSMTAMRCTVGQTKDAMVENRLQGSALRPYLIVALLDRLTDEVREEYPWTMMFRV